MQVKLLASSFELHLTLARKPLFFAQRSARFTTFRVPPPAAVAVYPPTFCFLLNSFFPYYYVELSDARVIFCQLTRQKNVFAKSFLRHIEEQLNILDSIGPNCRGAGISPRGL